MEHGGYLDPYDLVWMDEDDEAMRIITADPSTALAGCGGVFTAVVTKGNRKLLHRLLDAGIKVHPHPQTGACHSYLLEQPDMLRELLQRGGLDPNYSTEDAADHAATRAVQPRRPRPHDEASNGVRSDPVDGRSGPVTAHASG